VVLQYGSGCERAFPSFEFVCTYSLYMAQYCCGEAKPHGVILSPLPNHKIRCITGGTAVEPLLSKLTTLASQERGRKVRVIERARHDSQQELNELVRSTWKLTRNMIWVIIPCSVHSDKPVGRGGHSQRKGCVQNLGQIGETDSAWRVVCVRSSIYSQVHRRRNRAQIRCVLSSIETADIVPDDQA